MPFTRTNWMNYSPPAINAANLLNMEDGIWYGLAHSGGVRNTAEFLDRNPASTTGGLAEAIADLAGGAGVVFAAPHNHPINGNYAIPATVHLIVSRGATLTIANGVTLTINGTMEVGLYQIFNCIGTGQVVFGLGSTEKICPEWWGAIADGATDCQPAVTLAIESMFASGIATINWANGTYYYDSPVSVILDTFHAFRFEGTSTASMITGGTIGGTKFTGKAGIESMFIFTKTDLTVAGGYSFECNHISFESGGLGTTGPVSAIINKVAGYPARPFVVENCEFRGFHSAIVSDITLSGLTTGICQVTIRKNDFHANVYALVGKGGLGAIMDLDFSDNVSENGGKILTTGLGMAGTLNISDNLLEGQADTIVISAGLCAATIERNYFEANSGYIVQFDPSNPNSYLRMAGNYYTNCAGARVDVSACRFECDDDLETPGVELSVHYLLRKSTPSQNVFYLPSATSTIINNLNVNIVRDQLEPQIAFGGETIKVSADGTILPTPLGWRGYEVVAGLGTLWSVTGGLAIGDYVIVSALVKSVDSDTVKIILYSNASVYIHETVISPFSQYGEWVFIHAAIRAVATSAGTFKVRFEGATTIHVADFYVYKEVTPSVTDPLYAYLPMLEDVGEWQVVGAAGKPAFQNAWVNFGGGNATAAYFKDSHGVVHLKGLIKSGVIGSSAFALPVGFRPAAINWFAAPSNNAYGDCRVSGGGTVTPITGVNTWFSLSGITFKAA